VERGALQRIKEGEKQKKAGEPQAKLKKRAPS
jgi:hypothetical protein